MTVPEGEKVLSFAWIESLTHLLDGYCRILGETSLQLSSIVLIDFLIERVLCSLIALLLQELQDGIIYVLLRCCKVIEIDAATWAAFTSFPKLTSPSVSLISCTWSMSTIDTMQSLGIAMITRVACMQVSIRRLITVVWSTAVHLYRFKYLAKLI